DQRPRELRALPIAIDDRQYLVTDEVAGAPQVVALLAGELVADPEVIRAQGPTDALVHDPVPSAVEDVGPRRAPQRRHPPAAEAPGPPLLGAAALAEPHQQIGPPAALHGLGGPQ